MSKFYFELFKAKNFQWAWHLKSRANGKIISWSGETYHNKSDAEHGISLVKAYALDAPTYEI